MYTTSDNNKRQPFDWNNIAQELGLSDEELTEYRTRGEKIMRQAEKYGLKITEGSMELAGRLADEYGLDRLLEAIPYAVDVQKWTYVIGVLKRGRGRKTLDLPERQTTFPEDKWFDPNADRSCLDEWGGLG